MAPRTCVGAVSGPHSRRERGLAVVIPVMEELCLAAGLLAALALALDVGFRAGRRAGSAEHAGAGNQVGAIQGAVLGLLGLLLAFSFAAAGTRFMERQDLIGREANAIGTSWLRADLLDEPQRSELKTALAAYTAHRLESATQVQRGWDPAVLAEFERLHERIWKAASSGVAARPELGVTVLPPVNELIDVHTQRFNATLMHLPYLVQGLLVACSLLAVTVIGYGCGMDGKRRWFLTLSLAVLIASSLWITIDLDQPRRGILQLDDAPLRALKFETQ